MGGAGLAKKHAEGPPLVSKDSTGTRRCDRKIYPEEIFSATLQGKDCLKPKNVMIMMGCVCNYSHFLLALVADSLPREACFGLIACIAFCRTPWMVKVNIQTHSYKFQCHFSVLSLKVKYSVVRLRYRLLRPRWVLQPSEHRHILRPTIPLHLLPFLGGRPHHPHTLIRLQFLIPNPLKAWMCVKMLRHPDMQVLHVRNRVHFPTRLHHKCILGIQTGTHDPLLVFASLEMRVGEAEEDLAELGFVEEVGEEFHGVGSEAGDVVIA